MLVRRPGAERGASSGLVHRRPVRRAAPRRFRLQPKSRKEIDFVGEPLAGTAVEGKYTETVRWRGEAVTVKASDWAGVLTTRNVLDCTDPADAWAVPAGILAALVDT